MSYQKTVMTGKANSAISGVDYSGQFDGAEWSILEKKIGGFHVIIDAQLESRLQASHVKPQDSAGLINFLVVVSNYVNMLKEYKQIDDL